MRLPLSLKCVFYGFFMGFFFRFSLGKQCYTHHLTLTNPCIKTSHETVPRTAIIYYDHYLLPFSLFHSNIMITVIGSS